ncbi:hypothetical protein BYT27DRAFT_7084542 [Phlegmacium glaucopus]|nr:hypothetical protein BYT27DRAFT_7084542 [Phlegmacium glaucopus]
MTTNLTLSRNSHRETWTRERLVRERAIAIACAIEPSSFSSYSSALMSYLNFCSSHSFPIEPTPDTLSFYAVYMSHYIKPQSVCSYLSGICSRLEPFFPDVRSHRRHWLVSKALEGCRKMKPSSPIRKRALTRSELALLPSRLSHPLSHDDLLFLAITLTGFHGLLRLGELVWPDTKNLQDYRKVILRNTATFNSLSFQFLLPGHKADCFFKGNLVIIQKTDLDDDPLSPFTSYLRSRDRSFPLCAELWLRSDGSIPTRSWFLQRLRSFFPTNVGGHSLRAGGATALADAGLPPHIIQAVGRWASDTFQIYIQCHPVLLTAFLHHFHPIS